MNRDRKAINQFMRDASDAGKILGSHVPGVKHAIEGYEIAKTTNRLSKSAPKAYRAARREITRKVTSTPKRAVRNFKKRFGL